MRPPAIDSPYVESVPDIGTFRSNITVAPLPTGWSALPFSAASQVLTVVTGLLVLGDGQLYVGSSIRSLSAVVLSTPQPWLSGARIAAWDANSTTIVAGVEATGTYAHSLTCNLDAVPPTCAVHSPPSAGPAVGLPHAAVLVKSGGATSLQLWVGGESGLVAWPLGTAAKPFRILSNRIAALAWRDAATGVEAEVAVGSTDKLWLFRPPPAISSQPKLARFEWVTDTTTGRGGPIDDAVGALVYEASSGTLYIGTRSTLQVRRVNGAIVRLEGLPCANISSVALTPNPQDVAAATTPRAALQLWVGCDRGAAIVDVHRGDESANTTFRYLNGARWHPGTTVRDVAALFRIGGAGVAGEPAVAMLTDSGLSIVRQQLWTLMRKAAHYEEVLTRHHRHSLVATCHLPSYGSLDGCHMTSGDNDGLWTSLTAVAESLRYASTGNASAKRLAFGFFEGLELLNNVTGKPGLMARSINGPGERYDPEHHDKTRWHNSTTMPGWVWKGDTSSDEVAGHFFGYSAVREHATDGGSAERARVECVQLTVARELTNNGFVLMDVTGEPTTWGRWDPPTINSGRDWSDERGLNSMQILAFLTSANATATANGDADLVRLLSGGYKTLLDAGYATNALNAKITSQCDDNYSDDELLMLPTYTHLAAASEAPAAAKQQLLAALRRNYDVELRKERSSLWGAIFLAAGGARSDAEHRSVVDDILWSLRSWPLDLRNWHVSNRHRLDITWRDGTDRFGRARGRSKRVLPPNERQQYRWNADPFEVDDGSAPCDPAASSSCDQGMEEADPTAWLLPYWMARYHGLVGA